jgi:hypothetical protein
MLASWPSATPPMPMNQARPIHRLGGSACLAFFVGARRTNTIRKDTQNRPSAALDHAHTVESEMASTIGKNAKRLAATANDKRFAKRN